MTSNPITGALSDDDTHGRRHALGRAGERLAAEYLRQRGLVVLERNWTCPQGELDIVCTDGESVVICEVKTRSGVDYGSPVEAVGPHKARKLRELATAWLRARDVHNCPVRFDVLSVLWPPGEPVRIEHYQEVC
ncbi:MULTISPECIES: YraN family protein [unclassified Actinopolyspora]|uniref:YraN family protein n=1 Tax=unclassified Actinopolyspora TaxID=2639451 RepID=UPI0013F5F0BC|nr:MULTISPECIES: YraN family protein [unclassified Actinopolyspora]NHD17244.1 YraN family protein [Actinopolyspora sp. BKK2]NHE76396.1 YraN family protein [Actinopolyspora sp. BKK1]